MAPPYATESANNGPTIMEGSTYHDATVRSTGLPAWNRDPREIKTDRPAGSAGAQSAIGRKPAEERVFRPTLLHLADRIGTRLRAKSKPWSNRDGPRSLRQPQLSHAIGNARRANLRDRDPCRDRRGAGARGPRGSP